MDDGGSVGAIDTCDKGDNDVEVLGPLNHEALVPLVQ